MQPEPLTFVDRPRVSHRIVTLAIFGVSVFALSKVIANPPSEPWGIWAASGICLLCVAALANQFLFRPVRVTTIDPKKGLIVIEEKAPLRERCLAVPITFRTHFDVSQDDGENNLSFRVRLRSEEHRPLPVMEFLSKTHAEEIARQANAGLRLGA